ncbi:MAG: F0F1 ATP synthase subunit B [Planctomycetota bacterium]|nr:F0F1 ATP synthase subunit B [Planctomycetota bacterium]
MTKGGKTALKLVGAIYLLFLVVFFLQLFYAQELIDIPQIETSTILLPEKGDDKGFEELAEKNYVPAAVLEPAELSGMRFPEKVFSGDDWHRLRSDISEKHKIVKIIAYLGPKEGEKVPAEEHALRKRSYESARSFAEKEYRLKAPLKVKEEGKERVVFAPGVLIGLRELALLCYWHSKEALVAFDGKLVVEGRGSVVQINATLAFVILNFALLVALFYAFLWEPLTKALDERALTIRESLRAASEKQKQAEELLQKYEEQLEGAAKEAEKLKTQKLNEAEIESERIRRKAKESSEQILKEAQERAKAEFEKAKKALHAELAEFTIAAAAKILMKEVDETVHKRTVEEFLSEMEKGSEK